MSEWQPIESAPRDTVALIVYAATEKNTAFPGRVDVLPVYFDEEGRVLDYATSKPEVGIVSGYWRATHWMPLPEPPARTTPPTTGCGGPAVSEENRESSLAPRSFNTEKE